MTPPPGPGEPHRKAVRPFAAPPSRANLCHPFVRTARELTAMPSPLPGMDPYLEDETLWPVFHHQFVMCLYQILHPGLVDRYKARVCQRCYATEQALFTSIIREEHHEDYIEIRQR